MSRHSQDFIRYNPILSPLLSKKRNLFLGDARHGGHMYKIYLSTDFHEVIFYNEDTDNDMRIDLVDALNQAETMTNDEKEDAK